MFFLCLHRAGSICSDETEGFGSSNLQVAVYSKQNAFKITRIVYNNTITHL